MLRVLFPALRFGCLALLLVAIGLTIPSVTRAEDEVPAASKIAATAKATPQGKLIQNLGDRAIAILADKNLNVEQRNNQFRDMLRNSFDLMTIGRFVIGRSWNAATPDQQKEYTKLFEELVVQTYSDRFALYTGEGFRVVSIRIEGEKDVVVNSEITHPDGSAPTTVDWRVRQRGDKMGIIDVVVEGVSMSVTQRQEYAAVIQDGGFESLLTMMRQRVQEATPVVAKANKG